MNTWTRRGILASSLAVAGCSAARISSSRGEIDTRVAEALAELYALVPGSKALTEQASGVLIMPRMNEGSFIYGGAYGEGALIIGGATVDYYAAASASFGLQIGAQRYRHALLFMTPESLADFRTADGWELGVDAEYTLANEGGAATATTTTFNRPIYAVIYGQEGLAIGAALEGTKYSRIIRT